MRLKQQTRILQRKAIESFTVAVAAFNSPHEVGRVTQVLLHMQHAFEMLLKASLVQKNIPVFDEKTARSVGLERCLELARQHPEIRLSDDEAGTIRAIDAMRDDEQHWHNLVDEQVLYLHARAAVTIFDEVLKRVFGEDLASHLPGRVLPISNLAPTDLTLLIDKEFNQIKELLQPRRRATHEARARIRTLLALESHIDGDTRVSSKDVDRVQKGIKEGRTRDEVFPRLGGIGTDISGAGVTVTVHFTKRQGMPVTYATDETTPAAAVREVDLQKKFWMSASELADRLGLSTPKARALREHLGIDADPSCRYRFTFGSQRHDRFSDNAQRQMQDAIDAGADIGQIWTGHKPRGRGPARVGPCGAPGCVRSAAE